jgi:hypothetical protein
VKEKKGTPRISQNKNSTRLAGVAWRSILCSKVTLVIGVADIFFSFCKTLLRSLFAIAIVVVDNRFDSQNKKQLSSGWYLHGALLLLLSCCRDLQQRLFFLHVEENFTSEWGERGIICVSIP